MEIFGFAGYSGSGKTTLIEKIIPIFVSEGFSVSVVKHAHHGFDFDREGKDSWRHRKAGAGEVLLASNERWVLLHESEQETGLAELIARLSPCDIVFVEGYKQDPIPKIEVRRKAHGLIHPEDPNVVAIASDVPIEADLPVFDLDRADRIAHFIKNHLGLKK